MIANISDCEDIVFISNNNVFPFEIKFSWLKNGISCHLYNNVLLSLRLANTHWIQNTCLKDEDGKICLKLGRQESKTLELLAKNKNTIIKRETIQNILWGSDEKDFYLARRLDVVITNLRKYLQIDPFVQIETTRGVGFSLIESI